MSSFTCFPELPTELRRKIFKETCHTTRILDLWPEIRNDKVTFHTRSRNPPAILHVSSEARDVGLQHYKPVFGTHFNRGLGGGPLYLSENPRIFVNWKSDIICPMLNAWPQGMDRNLQRLKVEFLLGFLSRLPLFRIAIPVNMTQRFEEKFGHELAWSRKQKEVIVFSIGVQFMSDPRFRSSEPVLLKFHIPGHEMGISKEPSSGLLHQAVDELRDKITANRDKCPALAGPFPPLVEAMIIGFDAEQ